jgi:hypothetical protein
MGRNADRERIDGVHGMGMMESAGKARVHCWNDYTRLVTNLMMLYSN